MERKIKIKLVGGKVLESVVNEMRAVKKTKKKKRAKDSLVKNTIFPRTTTTFANYCEKNKCILFLLFHPAVSCCSI